MTAVGLVGSEDACIALRAVDRQHYQHHRCRRFRRQDQHQKYDGGQHDGCDQEEDAGDAGREGSGARQGRPTRTETLSPEVAQR